MACKFAAPSRERLTRHWKSHFCHLMFRARKLTIICRLAAVAPCGPMCFLFPFLESLYCLFVVVVVVFRLLFFISRHCRLPALHTFDLCGGKKEGKSDLRWAHVTLKPQRRAPRWWKNITQTRWILTIEDNYARHSYFHQCPSSPTPPHPPTVTCSLFFCCFFLQKTNPRASLDAEETVWLNENKEQLLVCSVSHHPHFYYFYLLPLFIISLRPTSVSHSSPGSPLSPKKPSRWISVCS